MRARFEDRQILDCLKLKRIVVSGVSLLTDPPEKEMNFEWNVTKHLVEWMKEEYAVRHVQEPEFVLQFRRL